MGMNKMKKLLIVLAAFVSVFGWTGLCAEQRSNFTAPSNVGVEDLISKYKDGKVLLVRNDSTFIASVDENGSLSDIQPTDDLKRIIHDGQVCYGSQSGTLYYSCSGKIFTAKQKKNGTWTQDKYIEIPGTTVQRDKYRGSVLAYANWRYLPEDSIVVMNPMVNEDETELYFASNMMGSDGLDIWKSEKVADGVWSTPQKLGKNVNGKADENFPFLDKDGSLVFASNRRVGNTVPPSGKYNVFVAGQKKNDKTQLLADVLKKEAAEKERLAKEAELQAASLQAQLDSVNQLASHDDKSQTYSSVAEEGQQNANSEGRENGSLNNSQANNDGVNNGGLSETMHPEPQNEAEQRAEQSKREEQIARAKAAEREKQITKALASHPDSMIKVSENVLATKEMRIFYFEFDKGIPNGTYKEDLEIVLDFINAYPDSKFLIVGHTDERGSYEYNDVLSQKRADWVYFNLLVKGVKMDRLQTRGDGEYHPIYKNAKTEEEHQKNRRAEIIKLN